MTAQQSSKPVWDWMSPSTERLESKSADLGDRFEEFKNRSLTPEQNHVLEACARFLVKAREFLDRPAVSHRFPFFSRKHPHLVWELLHRVDEHYVLLLTDAELINRGIKVKGDFDLNIKEDKLRSDWIGPKGRLIVALENIQDRKYDDVDRISVKDALQIVNEQVDRKFWQLSANMLTAVCSALFLVLLMCLLWVSSSRLDLSLLGAKGLSADYESLIVLGLMGAYVSNLLRREDFLYVRGGPFFWYWLHHLMVKPAVGAFAAVLIYVLAKSKLIFSIDAVSAGVVNSTANQLVSLQVEQTSVGYAYAILTIASAFTAEKFLRSTLDSALKRLLQQAEKTVESDEK